MSEVAVATLEDVVGIVRSEVERIMGDRAWELEIELEVGLGAKSTGIIGKIRLGLTS